MPDTLRTFVAIELPGDLRARVVEHTARLRSELPDVRASWSREDNLHLTLKFLGNVPVANLPTVTGAVERATKGISPFELTISGGGVFPTRGRPSVIWLGAESAGIPPASSNAAWFATRTPNFEIAKPNPQHSSRSALTSLHAAIDNELAELGFAREARQFHPHLTIARLRQPQGARELAELHQRLAFAPQSCAVSEIVVFRSELLKTGSSHTPISRHVLK